jgi:hypothetical protein
MDPMYLNEGNKGVTAIKKINKEKEEYHEACKQRFKFYITE